MENYKDIEQEASSSSAVDDFSLGLLIFVINKSIVWLILIIIFSVALSVLYLRYAPRIYQASTSLMLKEQKNQQILGLSSVLGSTNSESQINQEMQLMKSNVFIDRVVSSLPLQIGYFKEGKTKFIITEVYTSSPFEVIGDVKKQEIYNVQIYVKFITKAKVYLGFNMNGKEYEWTKDTSEVFDNEYFSVRIHLKDKDNVTPEDLSGIYYFKFIDKSALVDEISNKLDILPVDVQTKTIMLQFKDRNPSRAKDIVATVADEFLKYDLERKTEGTYNTIKFINSQIDTFGYLADRFQDSIVLEKIRDHYIEGANYLAEFARRSAEYEEKSRGYEYDISLIETFRTLLLENKEYSNLPSLTFKIAQNKFDAAIDHINEAQQKRNALLLDVTPQHPNIRMLDRQIETEKIKLNKSIDKGLTDMRAALARMTGDYQKYLDELARIPGLQSKFQRLERMADIRNNFVIGLYEKKSNFLIASAGIVGDYVILDKAVTDPTPVSPNENIVKISGFAIGLLIGLIMIAIRYLLHNTIISIEDVERKTRAPLLGIVPRYKEELERSQIVVTQDPKSSITESFRALRTNLQFISNTPGPKIISTTSTIPGEGKTFVSLNIAAILTLMNKRVIIMDFDMRKPRLNKIFDVESHRGVSTMLSGQSNVDDCIMESGIPHLDFVTSGPVPPNPSELILLPRLHEILDYLKTKYDYIIIDTPPIGLVTDALEVLKNSDYPIYILRAAYSNRSFIFNINRTISESKIKNLSVVINDYGRGASGYGYSYGYNYGYNYGYGYAYGYSYYGAKYGEGYYTTSVKQKPVASSTNWLKKLFSDK